MYYDYFGLNQPPFRITPDTSLFFPGGNRGAVLEAMMYAIVSGEGIVKVVGEVGSGKTMLCRMLAVELPDNVEVVYLANPSLSPDNILHAIAFELKLEVTANDDRLVVMNKLQEYLLDRHASNRQVVVFVEEAQGMPLATLEQIRLLSNLETKQNKLLQIVLFGQPELDRMIADREIRQLKERITYSFYLNPLKQHEIRDYLNTRLRACGYRSNDPFSKNAVRAISRFSKGLLRRINILADKAMLSAYAGNVHTVTAKHVQAAARDSEFIVGWQRHRRLLLGFASVLVLLVLAVWFLPGRFLPQYGFAPAGNAVTPPRQPGLPAKHHTSPVPAPATANGSGTATIYQPQDRSNYYDYFSPGYIEISTRISPRQTHVSDAESPEGKPGMDSAELNVPPGQAGTQNIAAHPAVTLSAKAQLLELIEKNIPALSPAAARAMAEQLRQLPPETQLVQGDKSCNLCSSFIYRPLKMNEYL